MLKNQHKKHRTTNYTALISNFSNLSILCFFKLKIKLKSFTKFGGKEFKKKCLTGWIKYAHPDSSGLTYLNYFSEFNSFLSLAFLSNIAIYTFIPLRTKADKLRFASLAHFFHRSLSTIGSATEIAVSVLSFIFFIFIHLQIPFG